MSNKRLHQSHQVRVIGGKWRGQKINVIEQDGLRPTTDRVRETLFNWLALQIVNADCLDAFAGTGILGLEALSRDAKSVLAIEQSRHASHQIRNNVAHLKADNFQLIEADACAYLSTVESQFNIIFLDAPFAQPELLTSVLAIIIEQKLLHSQGFIYLELNKADLHHLDCFGSQIKWLKKKMAGQVCYALLSL